MPARRCVHCDHNWPTKPDYYKCPQCDGQTYYHMQRDALPDDEARGLAHSYRARRAFEEFYVARELARLESDIAAFEGHDAAAA